MGNEESTIVDESVAPETLSSRSLKAIADYIKSGDVRQIVVMTGAGISTAAGIPDFRSPKTGLYANLARLDLPYAEAVFDITYFREHPKPFYVLAKELYPGKFYPTISHAFISLLARKGLLKMLFTQNIDCLERAAGVPADKIIEAHGSFATQRCIECRTPFEDELMKKHVQEEIVPTCVEKNCRGLVKPDIVFFGEQLPEAFRHHTHVPAMADLAIVLGTSLSVYPFAGLPEAVRSGVPRLLFNMEHVGQIGRRADDVVVLGSCDSGVRKLASMLGWRDELEALWREIVGEKEAHKQLSRSEDQEELEEEIQKLMEGVDTVLHLESQVDISEEADKDIQKVVDGGHVERLARSMEGSISQQIQGFQATAGKRSADFTRGNVPESLTPALSTRSNEAVVGVDDAVAKDTLHDSEDDTGAKEADNSPKARTPAGQKDEGTRLGAQDSSVSELEKEMEEKLVLTDRTADESPIKKPAL